LQPKEQQKMDRLHCSMHLFRVAFKLSLCLICACMAVRKGDEFSCRRL